jgi:hypothetical protein
MTHDHPTPTTPNTSGRSVLLWRPDSEEAEVRPDVDAVAAFLNVHRDGVLAAIATGELLAGWFVDWEVTDAR